MPQHFLLSPRAKTLTLAHVMRLTTEEAQTLFQRIRWAATEVHPPGTSHSIPLTADDVLELARKSPQFARQVLAFQNPNVARIVGLELAVPAAVRQVKIGHDVHQTIVGLGVDDEFGLTATYSLTSAQARDIGQKLIEAADKVDASTPTRQ